MAELDPSTLTSAVIAAHAARMREVGMAEGAIQGHVRALRFVAEGGSTMIPEASIEPVASLPSALGLSGFEDAGRAALEQTAVIKLNGGLGTGMGLSSAKSLIKVRGDQTFLDLIAGQVLSRRRQSGVALPLVLMNSERTREESLAVLARYPELEGSVPLDFLQHRVPRLDLATSEPFSFPESPHLEWCPPGHGDLYPALVSSGMLDALRGNGMRYAFVSNADNLGGVLDLPLLGWFASEGRPFAMEVARRTVADKKGGHLALRNGRLALRESAQCPAADHDAFQDTDRHRFFNTNNLWLDLDALHARMESSPSGLELPVMQNPKSVRGPSRGRPDCVQLETAMGAAIECFEGAAAIFVPRDRFCPVKTTNDLLVVRSDAYETTADGRVIAADSEAARVREIALDPRFYGRLKDFEQRFAEGVPLLAGCRRLSVTGDYRFGAGVSLFGDVTLENDSDDPVLIPDGTRLGDEAFRED